MSKIFLMVLAFSLYSCGKDNITGDSQITNSLNGTGVNFTLENNIPVIICINNNMTNQEKADRLNQHVNDFLRTQNVSNPAPVYIQGQAISPNTYTDMIGEAIYILDDPRITNRTVCPARILSSY